MNFATVVFDCLIDSHAGMDNVDKAALGAAADAYLEHAGTLAKPPLVDLAREAALYSHDWIADPTPERWEQLRKASRALETERLNYFR